jgi:hypothetical protein
MSQTVQRQTNQTPAWLMFSGGVIGTVGAIVMRHAENADQLILALGSPAEVSHVAAVAHSSEWGLVLLITGAVVALTGIVVIAARRPM